MFSELNESNVLMFGIKNYSNPSFRGEEEFDEDFRKFKSINRLLNYSNINNRLILNTIIILQNNFTLEGTNTLLFYYTEIKHWGKLKSFLVYLDYIDLLYIPEVIPDYDLLQELEKI